MTPTPSKPVFLFLAIAAALALAAAVFFFMGGSQGGGGESTGGTGRSETVDKPGGPDAVAESRGREKDESSRSAAPVVKTAPVKAAEVFPPAYEKALAGIVGRVTEADGSPVKGATVELLGGLLDLVSADYAALLFHPETFAPRLEQQKMVTGSDGKFQFGRVDPRQYYLVGVNLGGGPRPQVRLLDRSPNAGEAAADLGDIVLDPPLTFTGKVVDEGGKPVAGARVRASALPSAVFKAGVVNVGPDTVLRVNVPDLGSFVWAIPSWVKPLFEKLPFPATTTGVDGSFTLAGVPAAQVTLLIDGADIPASTNGPIPPTKSAQKDLGEVVVNRGEEIEGQVVDERGAPIAGAEVMVGIPCPLASKELAFLRKPVKTGAGGAFTVKGIPSKTVAVVARASENHDWTPCPDAEVTGDSVKVTIPGPRTMLVKVTDADGAPLTATIALTSGLPNEKNRGFSISFLPQLTPPMKPRVEAAGPGMHRLHGLRAASYKVFAEAPGHEVGVADAQIAEDAAAETELTIKLDKAQFVKVTVLGKENGASVPLEAASVYVASERGFDRRGFAALGSARTDAHGVANARAVAEGKNTVVAIYPGYANGFVEIQRPEVKETTVQLLVGGTIEGDVWKGDKPVDAPTTIVLEPRGKAEVNLVKFSVTGLDGKFRFANLVPGKYRVMAMKRFLNQNFASVSVDFFDRFDDDENEPARAEVEVVDEQVSSIRIDMTSKSRVASPDDGVVYGRVLKNGAPLAKAQVSLYGPEGKRVRTNENGEFEAKPVKAGQYQIDVYSTGRGWQRLHGERIDVKPGEHRQVLVDVVTGGPVRGRVVSAETNEGLSGCWVQGYAQKPRQGDPQGPNFSEFEFDYSTQVSGMTNASGEFEIEDVPAGTYSFRVHHDKYAPAKVDNVRVERGSSPSPLTLALKGGITVSGRVEAPGSEKFTWSGLSFQRIDDPTMTGWAQLDERKEFNVSSLTPGKYRVWYYGSSGEDDSPTEGFDTLEVEVPAGGATGLTLRFEKAKPRTKIVPAEGK